MPKNAADAITADLESRQADEDSKRARALDHYASRQSVRLRALECAACARQKPAAGDENRAHYFARLARCMAKLRDALTFADMAADVRVLPMAEGFAAQEALRVLLLAHDESTILADKLKALEERRWSSWLRGLELFDLIAGMVEPMKSNSVAHHEGNRWRAALEDDFKGAEDSAFQPEPAPPETPAASAPEQPGSRVELRAEPGLRGEALDAAAAGYLARNPGATNAATARVLGVPRQRLSDPSMTAFRAMRARLKQEAVERREQYASAERRESVFEQNSQAGED